MNLRNRDIAAQKWRETHHDTENKTPFVKGNTYYVYVKQEAGGDQSVLFLERPVGEAQGQRTIPAYQVGKQTIANREIYRGELTDMPCIGKILGQGVIHYFQHGGDIKEYIENYGVLFLKKKGLLRRIWGTLTGAG